MAEQFRELNILRRKQVEARCGLSRSSIYALIQENKFPAPINLCGGRSVGWLEHEITAFLEQRVAESRSSQVTRTAS